jgi:hypothetical protein
MLEDFYFILGEMGDTVEFEQRSDMIQLQCWRGQGQRQGDQLVTATIQARGTGDSDEGVQYQKDDRNSKAGYSSRDKKC